MFRYFATASDGAVKGLYFAQRVLYNVQCDGQNVITVSAAGELPISAESNKVMD